MEWYLVSLWASCEHVFEFGIIMGSFSVQFWLCVCVCVCVWGGGQMEWTILDCGRAFPLHVEIMENSPTL